MLIFGVAVYGMIWYYNILFQCGRNTLTYIHMQSGCYMWWEISLPAQLSLQDLRGFCLCWVRYVQMQDGLIHFVTVWVILYSSSLFHTISVINSITRSSNRSTLSVYGFWSSPNPNIIHLSSLEKSRLRPERVAPRGASASSSSNC